MLNLEDGGCLSKVITSLFIKTYRKLIKSTDDSVKPIAADYQRTMAKMVQDFLTEPEQQPVDN